MQTLRSAISDISDDLKSVNLDDRFSFRFLANKLRNKIETFIKQDADARNILMINEFWQPLFNIELEDADVIVNSEYYEYCDKLKKSKNKLPDVYTTKYGNLIKIMNINNSLEYKIIKSFEYKDIKNREFKNNNIKYCWIENQYLFIPDVDVEEVKALGTFKDSQEVDQFNNKECDLCLKPLDAKLSVPDYILDISKQQVLKELASVTKAIVEDMKPNLNTIDKR